MAKGETSMKVQKQTSVKNFTITEGFVGRYQHLIKDVVIPYQYKVLCDEMEGVEKSHVIQNFINAGKALRGEDVGDGFYGMVFQDSDAAKWLEAVAYALVLFPDPELEATADRVIEIIAGAQDEDGYLNTYYTIKDRDKRWTNLLEGHELYCAGHMMEAAVAYYEATGKDRLLQVMLKNAECIYHYFVTEGHAGYPGHPEVELALLRMYRVTGRKLCLELAEHFLNVRGVDPAFYEKEAEKRSWQVWGADPADHGYQQSQCPVRELDEATGHSVRAVYLYTAMADLASETDDKELKAACERLWKSVTEKRMYVTGGIGSTCLGEAFTKDYDLPNDTAYAETCASIGLMFFASRMLENEVKGVYADVMERAFYNTVLAGMQLDGKRFFYVNPLEVVPGIAGEAVTHKHVIPQRPTWYACACCPPNVARLLTSIAKYAYGENAETAYCHLYVAGNMKFSNGLEFNCVTEYPYDFTIRYEVVKGGKNLALRIPAWSRNVTVRRGRDAASMAEASGKTENGYFCLDALQTGEIIELQLDGTPEFIYASPKIPDIQGCVALQRGPLVYCFEGVDNDGTVLSLAVDDSETAEVEPFDPELLRGVARLKVKAFRKEIPEGLYVTRKPKETECQAYAVPYYSWGNRGLNEMRVWMTGH